MSPAAWFIPLLLLAACDPATPCGDCTALTGVTVIDGTGAPAQAGQTVLLRDSLIVAMGPDGAVGLPPGTTVRALPGRYLIPGLVDAHAHVTVLRDPATFGGYDAETSRQVLLVLLAHGITLARNPAAPIPEGPALRDAVARGEVLGPTLVVAGPPINVAAGPGSTDSILTIVRRHAEAGVEAIKLYRLVGPADMASAAALADSLGLPVIAHLEATDPSTAAAVGVHHVTHAASWHEAMLAPAMRSAYRQRRAVVGSMRARLDWLTALDPGSDEVRAQARALARADVFLDPTLVAYAPRILGRDAAAIGGEAERVTPASIRDTWVGTLEAIPVEDLERGGRVWPKLLGLVRAYWEEGVTLLAGSDLPNPWVAPGISLHDELGWLVAVGIPPAAVLTIATRNGARAMGLDRSRGTLEPGKRADLVVLTADPLTDIRNSRQIESVWLAGRELRPDSLLAAAGVRATPP